MSTDTSTVGEVKLELYARVRVLSWTQSWIPPFFCLVYKDGIIIRIEEDPRSGKSKCTVLFFTGTPLTAEYLGEKLEPPIIPPPKRSLEE